MAKNSTVISGTPRQNSMKITESDADDRQLRAPPERQHDAERQRGDDAGHRDHQRHQQAAPGARLHMPQPEHAADQQEERDERKDAEEQDGVEGLVGSRGISSGNSSATPRAKVRFDPPVLSGG